MIEPVSSQLIRISCCTAEFTSRLSHHSAMITYSLSPPLLLQSADISPGHDSLNTDENFISLYAALKSLFTCLCFSVSACREDPNVFQTLAAAVFQTKYPWCFWALQEL
jgi:hypothetical protein